METLRLEGVTKHYPNFALKDVSFSLESGRIMGFVGRNGAGKTTTLKAIMNVIHLDGGKITVFGRDHLKEAALIKKDIGFMLNGTDLFPAQKIGVIAGVWRRFYDNWDKALFKRYLEHFSLDPRKRFRDLSQGMKIKFLLSLALSHKARLLILDEPTTGLDPVAREEILDLLEKLVADGQRTVLFSTHIISDLDKIADDVTYIRNGEIILSEPRADLCERYRLLSLSDADFSPELAERAPYHLIHKNIVKALIPVEDAAFFLDRGLTLTKPNLEDIIVLMESQTKDHEEFAF